MSRPSLIKCMAGWLPGNYLTNIISFCLSGLIHERGDLKNERNKAEYERGYKVLLDFL
jgi:hypothetical protein